MAKREGLLEGDPKSVQPLAGRRAKEIEGVEALLLCVVAEAQCATVARQTARPLFDPS